MVTVVVVVLTGVELEVDVVPATQGQSDLPSQEKKFPQLVSRTITAESSKKAHAWVQWERKAARQRADAIIEDSPKIRRRVGHAPG